MSRIDLRIPTTKLKWLASRIRGWIKSDMVDGKLQTGAKFNYSEPYRKYKAKGMKTKSGRNLKSLRGQGVHSDHSSSVNMYLTGDLIEGLHADKVISTRRISYVRMAYAKKDQVKLLGNPVYADHILTLSKKNLQKARKLIATALNDNLKKYAKKKIIIRI